MVHMVSSVLLLTVKTLSGSRDAAGFLCVNSSFLWILIFKLIFDTVSCSRTDYLSISSLSSISVASLIAMSRNSGMVCVHADVVLCSDGLVFQIRYDFHWS